MQSSLEYVYYVDGEDIVLDAHVRMNRQDLDTSTRLRRHAAFCLFSANVTPPNMITHHNHQSFHMFKLFISFATKLFAL